MNRREFMHVTAGAAVAAVDRPRLAAQAQRTGSVGANERVRLAIIGSGSRGNQVLTSFSKAPNNTFVAACDVFKERLDSTVQRLSGDGTKVDGYEDYRRILDRQDIDAVLIATPDHWHPQLTIDAVAAGKDVYLEKPTSNAATLPTAAKALEVVRRTNRIVAGRHPAAELAALRRARKRCCRSSEASRTSSCSTAAPGSPVVEPVVPVPAGLNWDLFQGPAPKKPYKTGRQRQWRNYWDYGGGTVTDWGVHLVDTALWFMDAQLKAPKLAMGVGQYVNVQNPDPERPFNAFTASWQYDSFVMSFSNAAIGNPEFPFQGTVFIGPRGSLVVNRTGYMLRPSQAGGGGGRGRAGGAGAAAGVAPPVERSVPRRHPQSRPLLRSKPRWCAAARRWRWSRPRRRFTSPTF